MPTPPPPFPRWVPLLGFALALAYSPTLSAPFDFLDDGNLVYPTGKLSAAGHLGLWWDKVRANVEHLGPFRPVVWAHWQVAANVYGDNPVAWRAGRLVWCGLAGVMLLWLMRELRLHPVAALLATAAAMWNPYRNDIWTSLTLAEGVAMPYALLALVAARKAASTDRRACAGAWDVAALAGLLLALGCKNTFVALIPPMILLRTWTPHLGVRGKVLAAIVYTVPVLLAVGHFAYVKQNPGPHHYDTPGPSWGQAVAFASWMKGAVGLDFLGIGVAVAAVVVGWRQGTPGGDLPRNRAPTAVAPTIVVAVALLLAGFVVYLPVSIMCGRYTMPAVWGADVLLAALLSRLVLVRGVWGQVAWGLLGVGLAAVLVANVGRQEKLAARSRMLWELLRTVETDAPPGAVVEWVSGRGEDGELNAEEGIHFYWHLLHRGRGDVRVRLVDVLGRAVPRVELSPPLGVARFRIAAHRSNDPNWRTLADVRVGYHLGRRLFTGTVQEPAGVPLPSGQ